jgi:hypothetical protein
MKSFKNDLVPSKSNLKSFCQLALVRIIHNLNVNV